MRFRNYDWKLLGAIQELRLGNYFVRFRNYVWKLFRVIQKLRFGNYHVRFRNYGSKIMDTLQYTTSKLPPSLANTYIFKPADREPCSLNARFCKRTFGGHDGVGVGYGVGGGGMLTFLATSYVICCYAAEISGVVAALYVATLQRSLVLLLRYMLLRCRDVWCCCYGVYTKGCGVGGAC